MHHRANIIYVYDGSFDGFLCCIFESYIQKEIPLDIVSEDKEQASLYPSKYIETNKENAHRVFLSLSKKMGKDGEYLVKTGFLYGLEEKELWLYHFIRMGYHYGKSVCNMLGDEVVSKVQKMVLSVRNEAHLMVEFLRFTDYNGGLVAVIEPKHFVLPIMEGHFCGRFPEEHFFIYDETHKVGLLYRPFESQMIAVEDFILSETSEQEREMQQLWTRYYDTIAIKERENPRCRMTHMPKRFWKNMVELNGQGRLPKKKKSQIEKGKDKLEQ